MRGAKQRLPSQASSLRAVRRIRQIFIGISLAQELAGLGARASLIQISARGSTSEMEDVIRRLSGALPGLEVRPVRQTRGS